MTSDYAATSRHRELETQGQGVKEWFRNTGTERERERVLLEHETV
jgi:hypothetical protein